MDMEIRNKKKPGPKSALTDGELLQIIRELGMQEEFDDQFQLPPPSSALYKTIVAHLGNNKIITTTRAIYARLQRHNKRRRTAQPAQLAESYPSSPENVCLVFAYEDWVNKLRPTPNNAGKLSMPVGWTDAVAKAIHLQLGILCPWSFIKHAVTPTGIVYLTIFGSCKECGSSCKVILFDEPEGDTPVRFDITISDGENCRQPHVKKRHLKRAVRAEVAKELEATTAYAYRLNSARTGIPEAGDPEHPTLYSADVLRQCRSEAPPCGSDEINRLAHMKHTKPYCGSIGNIGYDVFFIHYCTPAQTQIMKSTPYRTLEIDATGSVATGLQRGKYPQGPIYLYQIILTEKNAQVGQMLTESHSTLSIQSWLSEWLEISPSHQPKEVVVDDSAALKAAVCRAFNNGRSIADYKEATMQFLLRESTKLPATFIRLDVTHIMKIVANWQFWKVNMNTKRLKKVYMKCMAGLVESTSLAEFKALLQAWLTVSMTPHKSSHVEQSLQLINQVVRFDKAEDYEDADAGEVTVDRTPTDSIKNFLANVKLAVEAQLQEEAPEGDELNPLYAPEVAQKMLDLSADFPLWSGVLVVPFGSPHRRGSSSRVQSFFALLKKQILLGRRLSVDELVATHLRAIDGESKIRLAPSPNLNITRYNPPDPEHAYQKDWKGKVSKRAGFHFLPAPPGYDAASAALGSKNVIPPSSNTIIRHGNLWKVGFLLEGKGVMPRNTCGNDALATCIRNSGIMESENFRQEAMASSDPVIKIAASLATEGATAATYAAQGRAALQYEYDDSGREEIDLYTSISNIID